MNQVSLQGIWTDDTEPESPIQRASLLYPAASTSASFASDPSHVLFDHCDAGSLHQKTVRIINKSEQAQRVHVLPASHSTFRFVLNEKRGNIAPGLTQAVQVEFRPESLQTYSTKLHVQCPVRPLFFD